MRHRVTVYRLCQPIRTALARIRGTRLGMICVSISLMSRAGAGSIVCTPCLRHRPSTNHSARLANVRIRKVVLCIRRETGRRRGLVVSRGEIAKFDGVALAPFRSIGSASRLDDILKQAQGTQIRRYRFRAFANTGPSRDWIARPEDAAYTG